MPREREGPCGVTIPKLKAFMAEIESGEVNDLKDKEYMMALAKKLVEDHEEITDIRDDARLAVECHRTLRMLEKKIITSQYLTEDECDGVFSVFKRKEILPEEITIRCPSPSPVGETPTLDAIHDVSVFLDPDEIDKEHPPHIRLVENEVLTFSRISHYNDPILQMMNEQMKVTPLYDLAEEVIFRTQDGCKGILGASKDPHKKEEEEDEEEEEEDEKLPAIEVHAALSGEPGVSSIKEEDEEDGDEEEEEGDEEEEGEEGTPVDVDAEHTQGGSEQGENGEQREHKEHGEQ